FCSIYFAIAGLETERFTYRVGAWALAIGCLFVLTLSVERGPLLAAALALTVVFRGLLKRGFIPLFVLIILTGAVSLSGLFDRAVSQYSTRGTEDTGRVGSLWPDAIERISKSPVFGEGASKVGTPHNTFLLFALSSGIVPLVFYIAFWIRLAWRSVV